MRNFFVKISIVALVVIVAALAVEIWLMYKPNEFSYRLDYIRDNKDKISTLLLGQSQINNGVIPELLSDSAFCCAVNGKPTYIDHYFLEMHIDSLPALRTVIFPIGYNLQYHAILGNDKYHGFRESLLCHFNRYWGIPVENSINPKYYSEILCTRGYVLSELFLPAHMCKPTGWDPSPDNEGIPEGKIAHYSAEDYDDADMVARKENNISHMRAIAQLCKDRNIDLVILTTPYLTSQIEGIDQRGLDELQICADAMTEVYPKARYLNYMYDPRFVYTDYYDVAHLNAQGAKKFTEILKHDLNM